MFDDLKNLLSVLTVNTNTHQVVPGLLEKALQDLTALEYKIEELTSDE